MYSLTCIKDSAQFLEQPAIVHKIVHSLSKCPLSFVSASMLWRPVRVCMSTAEGFEHTICSPLSHPVADITGICVYEPRLNTGAA